MGKYTLKMLRARDNLTQKEVAKKIGVSEMTYLNWEKGKSYPGVPSILKLEKLFNVAFVDIKFLI
ncbi:helix-turn-helix transcriptional regulator [Lactococcus lactis]|uniref:helix-turn-helix transcriptional regulator n=1 Tax=Lactococcus lactis TaxID=1358 RepID=UPI000E6C1BAB|nr:helix-turn-helix transcriptional regulator [Lactococcus lactis]RJK90525.1 XRE family transcriptional regulator [Lactococcus lactis subsp. lactis]